MSLTQSKLNWFKYMSKVDISNIQRGKARNNLLYSFPKDGNRGSVEIRKPTPFVKEIDKHVKYVITCKDEKNFEQYLVDLQPSGYLISYQDLTDRSTGRQCEGALVGRKFDPVEISNICWKHFQKRGK